jgi:hypothetical protein
MSDLHWTAKPIVREAMAEKTPEQLSFLRALHDEYLPPGPEGPMYRAVGGLRVQLEDVVGQVTLALLGGEEKFTDRSQFLEEKCNLPVAWQDVIAQQLGLRERPDHGR